MSFEDGFTDVVGSDLFRAKESAVESSDTSGCSCSIGKFDKDVAILKE
jgi:hypothetical protein